MKFCDKLRHVAHEADFCVVGGGLAGMLAAVAAARRGVKTVLMHDRPVFGGNASSEIRMWVRGAHGENNQETGILEELLLDNMHHNPERNFAIWDAVLFGLVKSEKNLTALMNCSCMDAKMSGGRIKSVTGWQLTTYTVHTVEAALFADCSGDSVLAPLTGASYRFGRESSAEFCEDFAPDEADERTMGHSCLIQGRENTRPVKFVAPPWAHRFSEEDLSHRSHGLEHQNFWWMEKGGMQDTIHDTEEIRDELLKIALGVWDHLKNSGAHPDAENWELDFLGFLPGKRESRRYEGDHMLTHNDVLAEGRFDDIVAYGGWPVDDHPPEGFDYRGAPTRSQEVPSPFGIPYRCLYSKNVENLFFAGRNISATHVAMSSSRVMGTCAILGQAVGTAAALCTAHGLTPRGLYEEKIKDLQQALMEDDCFLPFNRREPSDLTKRARLSAAKGDCEALRDGVDRPIGEEDHGFFCDFGESIQYTFAAPEHVAAVRLVFDSDLNRHTCALEGHTWEERVCPMLCNRPAGFEPLRFPQTMVKSFKIELLDELGAVTRTIERNGQIHRLERVPVGEAASAVRFTPLEGHGAERAHLFSFEVE